MSTMHELNQTNVTVDRHLDNAADNGDIGDVKVIV